MLHISGRSGQKIRVRPPLLDMREAEIALFERYSDVYGDVCYLLEREER
ncbi:MAG: hypothetical protein JXA08_03090 [Methanomicrobiaceae archaeon]|nr:hypothetical protein [Methanomicrobiaceae archaeon]